MLNSKEEQGEIRKPSKLSNAKKQRKTKQNKTKTNKKERVEISSRKLRYQGNISCKDGTVKDRNGMDLTEAERQ